MVFCMFVPLANVSQSLKSRPPIPCPRADAAACISYLGNASQLVDAWCSRETYMYTTAVCTPSPYSCESRVSSVSNRIAANPSKFP